MRPELSCLHLCLILFASDLTAQLPSREDLAKAVGKAHRAEAAATVDRFRARIKVLVIDAKSSINLDLAVTYGRQIPRSKTKKMAMGRFTFFEANTTQTLGVGARGPWLHKKGKTERLTSRSDAQTRKNLRGYLALCAQMLKFLDPGPVLAGLQGKKPVGRDKLRLLRKVKRRKSWQDVPALTIEGVVDAFPRFGEGEGARPQRVRLKAWIEESSKQLLQLQITPLGPTGLSQNGRAELVVFQAWHDKLRDGRRLPRTMVILQLQGKKRSQPTRVELVSIALNPELKKSDFAPPEK